MGRVAAASPGLVGRDQASPAPVPSCPFTFHVVGCDVHRQGKDPAFAERAPGGAMPEAALEPGPPGPERGRGGGQVHAGATEHPDSSTSLRTRASTG